MLDLLLTPSFPSPVRLAVVSAANECTDQVAGWDRRLGFVVAEHKCFTPSLLLDLSVCTLPASPVFQFLLVEHFATCSAVRGANRELLTRLREWIRWC
jgi:hypothetical protein